jgi:glycosyltransferase involved in cell wall biosynthesis
MRILHVIDSAGIYGAEKVLLSLAMECARAGHEVSVGTIVSPLDSGDPLGAAVRSLGLHHVSFGMADGFNLSGLWRIRRYAKDQSIDLIHSHGYKANILLGCLPRRLRGWALVCTLHGWTSSGRKDRLWLYETLERRLIRRFDQVVAVSDRVARQVAGPALQGRLATIPNGIPVPSHADRTGLPDFASQSGATPLQLLAVGRLGREKGFDLLLEAIGRLRDIGIIAHLRIAGEGPERSSLQRQIEALALSDAVELLGYRQDVESLHRASDFFVLSSRTEGLPIVLLEAMLCETPVVATAVGDVPAVLEGGRCGWIATEPSVDALTQALTEAIVAGEPERRRRVQCARSRVEAAYSATAMANRYLATYSKLLDEPARRARASDGAHA